MASARKSTPIQWGIRMVFYALGLFCIALGVAFAVNSDLGTSPVSSLPYVLSKITNLSLGSCVFGTFCFYLALQVLLLGKKFRPVQLLQLPFSVLFGYFTDFAKALLGDFCLPGYPGRLVMLAASILLIALGVFLYVEVHLVPMSTEGLTLTVAQRCHKPFPTMKVVMDCAMVLTGVVLSMVFLGKLVGVREGTVLSALLLGKTVAVIRKRWLTSLQKLCFIQSEA